MPEPKKGKRSYNAQVDSQVSGLRLVRQQRPPASQPGSAKPDALSGAPSTADPHAAEPELVSKLINFIKTI